MPELPMLARLTQDGIITRAENRKKDVGFSLAYLVAMFLFQNRRRRGDLLAGAWPHGLAAGLIFGVHILLYFWALKLTSVTVVFLLGALNPAVVGVFGWLFLNERLRPSQAFWTAMERAFCPAIGVPGGKNFTP